MMTLADLTVKIFADGADLDGIVALYAKPWIKGFTTNPTLMRKAGVTDYKRFALEVLQALRLELLLTPGKDTPAVFFGLEAGFPLDQSLVGPLQTLLDNFHMQQSQKSATKAES